MTADTTERVIEELDAIKGEPTTLEMIERIYAFVVNIENAMSNAQRNPMAKNMLGALGLNL